MKHLHLFMITIASYNTVLQAAKMPESKSSRSENSSHLSPIIKPEKRLIAQPSMLQTIKSSMQSFIEYFLGSEKNSSETITELKSVRTSDLKLQQKINTVINNLEELQIMATQKSNLDHISYILDTNLQALDDLNNYTLHDANLAQHTKQQIARIFEGKLDASLKAITESQEPVVKTATKRPLKISLVATVQDAITKLSQPQLDHQGNGFVPTTGAIETPQEYISQNSSYLKSQFDRFNHSLLTDYNQRMNYEIKKALEKKYQEENSLPFQNTTGWTATELAEFARWKEQSAQVAWIKQYQQAYQEEHPMSLNRTIENLATDLENYQYVINSRGDGNCGYRAVLVSSLMQGLDNPQIFSHLESIMNKKFTPLFKKYKNSTAQNIPDIEDLKTYCKRKLKVIKSCNNLSCIQRQIQNDTTFDYAMIMFERYMMADFIRTEATEEEAMILQAVQDVNSLDQAIEPILRWKEELDQDTTSFLARSLGITIQTVQRNTKAPVQIITPERSFGRADILYIPGHYQILVPKSGPTTLEELS